MEFVDNAITFADTDPAADHIGGIVTWQVNPSADLGFTTHYGLYCADNSAGTNQIDTGLTAAKDATELVVPHGTHCPQATYILMYAVNPNGLSAQVVYQGFNDFTTTGTTRTTTTATTETGTTSTITTADLREAVRFLQFADENDNPGYVHGLVEWEP